jgi:TolA-binding protein
LPEAYYYLGTIHADRGELNEAEGYLRQVVDSYPDSDRRAEAAVRLGDLLLEKSEPGAAQEQYGAALQMNPDASLAAEARYGQGVALLRQGQLDRAERIFERMLEGDAATRASTELARLGLGRLYEQRGNTDDAITQYRQVARQSQSAAGAEALYRLGALLVESGQPRDALDELGRMAALFGGYPEWMARGLLAEARAYRALGERGEAVRAYDRVIEQYPDTPYAATARQEKDAL